MSDRHGIVAKSVGLLHPNDYLAVAISYLFYAESFKGRDHLTRIQAEAQEVIQKAYQAGAAG